MDEHQLIRREAFFAGRLAGIKEAAAAVRRIRSQLDHGPSWETGADIWGEIVELISWPGQVQAWEKCEEQVASQSAGGTSEAP